MGLTYKATPSFLIGVVGGWDLGLYGDYYFTKEDAAAIAATGGVPFASTPLLDGWSAA